MERDKDYGNAFHYLEILLQVRGCVCCGGVSQVLGWRGPGPGVISVSLGGAIGLAAACVGCRSHGHALNHFTHRTDHRFSLHDVDLSGQINY